MKKVVSLLLAVLMTATIGIGVFAAEDVVGFAEGTLRDDFNALYDDATAYDGVGDQNGMGVGIAGRSGVVGGDDELATQNGVDNGVMVQENAEDNAGYYDAALDFGDYDNDTTQGIAGRLELITIEGIDDAPDVAGYRVSQGEIILVEGTTNNKTVVHPEAHLEPGTEYTFNFYVVTEAPDAGETTINVPANTMSVWATPVTNGMLGNGRLRLSNAKGTGAVSSAKIERRGSGVNSTYNLILTTRDNYGTKITDTSYTLSTTGSVVGVTDDVNFVDGYASFRIGYETMDDDEVDSYSEDDIITVLLDTPVFTKRQLERIARNYNYKAVEFEAEDAAWYYTGRVSGMSDTNFVWTHDVIPAIMNRMDDYDMKFLTFNAGVTFPTNGEMRIDVSDVSDDWDRIYTYLYRNGSLTPVNTSYDAGADEIIFRTNYLGAFVMTEREITDLTILDTNNNNNQSSINPDEESGVTAPGTNNPPMGLPSMNLVIGLGAVSLLAAGTVVIRKKK